MAYPDSELLRFKRWRVERVLSLAAEGGPDMIHGTLLLAMASRETNMTNVVGGGYFDDHGQWHTTGTDRGLYQFNAPIHERWLRSVRGCASGSYAEVYMPEDGGAFPEGRVPGLTASTKKAIAILRFNITYARKQGIPEFDLVRVAVAGWNSGVGTSINAYKQKGDPDYYTTGKDYSRDVLERQGKIRAFIQRRGWGK